MKTKKMPALFFSCLQDGNMSPNWGPKREVQKNIKKFCEKIDTDVKKIVHIKAEHGNRILHVNERNAEAITSKGIRYDGLVTVSKNLSLTLAPADCNPVVITNTKGSFVSLLHVGRKGAELKIVTKAIDSIIRRRLEHLPENLILKIGPGIKKCCYDIDLVRLIKQQARSRSIPYGNISVSDVCTCCGRDNKNGEFLFFSHRRSVLKKEAEGRFITIVSLRGRLR